MGPKQRSTAAASALAGTLHDAETRQLEDFIKKRSKALDGDISEMRKRLSKGAPDQLASGGGVFTPASVETIQISGVGLSTHSQGTTSAAIEASSSELDAAAARNRAVFERSQPVQPRAATMKDRLGTFLARIKIRADDCDMTALELRNLLLPLDLCLPSDTQASINELIYVLQTDLVIPVSREDQLMLLQEYGDSNGDVNIKAILSDAGVWHEIPLERKPDVDVPRKAGAAMSRIRAGGLDDPVLVPFGGDENLSDAKETRLSRDPRGMMAALEESVDEHSRSPSPQRGGAPGSRMASNLGVTGGASSRPDSRTSSAAATRPQSAAMSRAAMGLESTLGADFQATDNFKTLDISPLDTHANEMFGDVIGRSAANLDVLSEIHRIVANDLEPEARPVSATSSTSSPPPSPTKVVLKEKPTWEEPAVVLERTAPLQVYAPHAAAAAAAAAAPPLHSEISASASATSSAQEPPSARDQGPPAAPRSSDPRNLSLAEENARLRSELQSFDGEFWEQLEDLKFRYSRLQEVVGEEPELPARGGSASGEGGIYPMRPTSKSGGRDKVSFGQPIDSLPWSTRNAMTAMDRAGITSSLARGRYGAMPIERPEFRSTDRPHANAYTYAPGVRPGTGNILPVVSFDANKTRGTQQPARRGNKENDWSRAEGPPSPPSHQFSTGARPPPGPSAPLLRHSTGSFPAGPLFGGIHGVGGGTHAPESAGTGSLASMCERRLLFELGNHPAPEQSARQLIHRIQDVAHTKGDRGRFITPFMLSDVLTSVGLRMGLDEVTMLATGFGSNGRGGIDSQELCEALQALLYNFIGEHEVVERERRQRAAGQREFEHEEDSAHAAMVEICMSIMTHDKKAILGAGVSLYDTLVDPFASADTSRLGVLAFPQFSRVLRDLGVMLDHQENLSIATRFEAKGPKAAAALGREHSDLVWEDDAAGEFRDERLRGNLRGMASEDPTFGNWLASTLPSKGGGKSADSANLAVDYSAFVAKLADIMETIIEREGGLIPTAGLGGRGTISDNGESERLWMLKEFDLIEALICQLELMRPSERRRCLLSLQYAVTAADAKQDGEIDGFSLLSALLGAGFRLQRLNRVRLLRAIEDMGGKVDHVELCQVLIRSCADWTSEERGVVSKILKAMGVTVLERRAWLGRIRVALMKAAADYGGKAEAFNIDTGSSSSSSGNNDPGIPPSAFLHILRDNGVILGVEEEATLLDCLDTERLADLGRAKTQESKNAELGPEDGIARAISSLGKGRNRSTAGEASSNTVFGSWGVPLIHYKSFLSFCARHTGDWMDASPDNTERINEALRSVQSPATALQEFTSMLQAFDELSSGFVGNRAFQIACHRSRLFANLSDESVKETANILTAEGGGKIRYMPFLVHLRAVCSQLSAATEYPGIGEQLLKNCMDGQGCLLPLRNWLLRNTDTDSCLLTPRDINGMLREFSVMYRPDDLEAMLLEIGKSVGSSAERSELGHGGGGNQSVLDTRDLFRYLFKIRGPWSLLQTELCQQMVKSLAASGAQTFAASDADGANRGASAFGFPKSPKGIESAAARRLLARLRAFADIVSGERLVDLDIFGHVARVTGLPLSDDELLVLADATDPHPCARQVRCDVVVEALTVDMPSLAPAGGKAHAHGHGHGSGAKDGVSEAAQYALKHMQDQLWTTGLRLRRSPTEWIADVKAAFKGFDTGGAGFVTTEDFGLALSLLNASVSTEIMRDIPIVPDGPGLIAYLEILERVLVPPPTVIAQARAAERGKGAGNDSVQVDRLKMPRPGAKADRDGSGQGQGHGQGQRGVSLEAKGTAAGVARGRQASGAGSGSSGAKGKEKDSPVSVLVNVIRKALHSFITTDDTLESAWMCLLKAFRRFDPNETGTVPPRDFCLAVSVLLGGDEVLLGEEEWREIAEHFAYKDDKKKARAGGSGGRGGGGGGGGDKSSAGAMQVDYMHFCGTVLDKDHLKAGASALKSLSTAVRAAEQSGATHNRDVGGKPIGSGGKPATMSALVTTAGSLSRDRARAKK